jgi:hypothetical protein
VLLLLHALRTIAAGDLRGSASLISTRSAQEEIEDEIRDLEARHARNSGG